MSDKEIKQILVSLGKLEVNMTNVHNGMNDIKKAVSNKANKWVEKGVATVLSAMVLYFLGAILGMFKIASVSLAYTNILNLIV